jgi:hypothetical protein
MCIPQFRLRTLMIAVAVGTVVLYEAIIGVWQVGRWDEIHRRGQMARDDLKTLESWTGARRAQPGYASALSDYQRVVAENARTERERRPHVLNVACLIAVVVSPFILAVRAARRSWKGRRSRDEITRSPSCDSPGSRRGG